MSKKSSPNSTRDSTIMVEELRLPLTEAQDTLRALRRGEVDALVVKGKSGEQVLAIHDADQPYRVLVEKMQEGAATLDKEGAVLYCNDRLASLLRTTTKRLMGTSIYHWVAPESQEQLRKLLYAPEMQRTHDLALRAASDDLLEARVTVTAVSLQGMPGVCLSIADVTAVKRMERALRLVQELTAILANTQDLDKALGLTLRKLGEAGGWSWGEAWLLRADRSGLECRRRWDAEGPDGISEPVQARICLRGMGLVGRAWAENRPLWVQEPAGHDLESKLGRPSTKTGMAIPILGAGKVVAVIAFYVIRPRGEDVELLRLAQTATEQLGPYILNKKTEEAANWLAAILQSTDEAIIGQDLHGAIVHWSAGAQKLYGYAPAEIIGRPFSLLVPPEHTRQTSATQKQAEGGTVRTQAIHWNKQGRQFPVALLLAPIHTASGQITGSVVIARPA